MARADKQRPIYASCVVERADNHILILLPHTPESDERRWQFPRGLLTSAETPEDGMRRVAKESLGIEVEIVVGQPPVALSVNGEEIELRYFFCGISQGEPEPPADAELRWVPKVHLREYDFDEASQPVVDWILAQAPGT